MGSSRQVHPAASTKTGVPPKNDRQSDGRPGWLDGASSAVIALPEGSGVIVSPQGWFLTAAHVVENSNHWVDVQLPTGKRVKAKMWVVDRETDVGIGRLEGEGPWPVLACQQITQFPVETPVMALGYPMGSPRGQAPSVRIGTLQQASDERLVSRAAIMGGDSGGALLSDRGYLIGIHSRINPADEDNIHLPLTIFEPFWKRSLPIAFPWAGRAEQSQLDEPQRLALPLQSIDAPSSHHVFSAGGAAAAATPLGNGWWLAKASLLRPPLALNSAKGPTLESITVNRELDLALLRGPKPPSPQATPWTVGTAPHRGDWVRSVTEGGRETSRWGLLALAPQPISLPFLDDPWEVAGIRLGGPNSTRRAGDRDYPVRQVHGVRRGSAADAAGIRLNDWLVLETFARGAVRADTRSQRTPPLGETLRLIRGGKLLTRRLSLSDRQAESALDRWGGPLSRPRNWPDEMLVHDSHVVPTDCGGPLLDARGRLIGINIARVSRVASFAHPWPKVAAWLSTTEAAADIRQWALDSR